MPDENPNYGHGEPDAPARLAEALRRLPQPAVLVPPQIDAAALSRPRLHLARLREMRGEGADSAAYRLDLAARAGEAGPAPAGQFLPRTRTGGGWTPPAWWDLAWKVLALAALAAAVLWLAREWRGRGRIEPAIKIQHTHPP